VRPSHWSRDKKLPVIGLDIYDSKAKKIGKISDVIGPVFKPYFKIKPSRPLSSSFSSLVGEPLYTMPDSRGKNSTYKSRYKDKNTENKRQKSNKFYHDNPSNTRNYSRTSKPRDKTPTK
jgi:rRNA processing protein Gar1